jgi:hypothetical protein
MSHQIFDYFKLRKIAEMFDVSLTKAHNWKHGRVKLTTETKKKMDSIVKFIENRG